jgi:DNA (cytosine-5)-methyltransferase 1
VQQLTVGSLFAGIGGIDLGLERTGGFRTVWFSEIDPFARAVLARHWPHVPCYGDVRETGTLAGVAHKREDGTWWGAVDSVDVLAAGFPGPPVSNAGKRLGKDDPRWLWPEVARLVGVLRPSFVLLENVPGLRSKGLGDVLGDLSALGYDAEWEGVPAAAFAAPHHRDRVWIVAYPAGIGWNGWRVFPPAWEQGELAGRGWGPSRDGWPVEPEVGRVAHGVPQRLVRAELTALGNAVVPQVAEAVGRLILAAANS